VGHDHEFFTVDAPPDTDASVRRLVLGRSMSRSTTWPWLLSSFPGVVAVAEPTSMTWLGLHVALQRAGCDLSLVGTRHAARLRGTISGKHKSDVIAADVLWQASDVFELSPLDPPGSAELALRRAVVRRGKLVIDGNRARRRLISLARRPFLTCGQPSRGPGRPRPRS